jgi:hypothetical protein
MNPIDAHGGATKTVAFQEALLKRQGELQLRCAFRLYLIIVAATKSIA